MIESTNNEKIKEYAKLSDKKYREKTGLFLIEGKHLIEEASKKGIIKDMFLLDGEKTDIKQIPITYVSLPVLKKLSSVTNPSKIIAVCYKLVANEIKGNILILDDISDPGNLGTIIRSAVAFDYQTIILSPKSVDIYNPKVIRASEGMLFNINIVISELLPSIKELKAKDYLILGTDVKKGKNPQGIEKMHALIIGSEANGVSGKLLSLTDENLKIEMNSICESLNAGVSASILMYSLNQEKLK